MRSPVRDSFATVLSPFMPAHGGTKQFTDKLFKPWLHLRPGVHPKFLAQFLVRHNVTTLNGSG